MSEAEFAKAVRLCCEIINRIEDWTGRRDAIDVILLDYHPFWREPIRVMAMGGYYYSADEWMAAHAQS